MTISIRDRKVYDDFIDFIATGTWGGDKKAKTPIVQGVQPFALVDN